MLVISADPYQSSMTVLYQRLTVIVTDVLLFYAILQSVTQNAGTVAAVSEHAGCPRKRLTIPCFVRISMLWPACSLQICADSHQLGRLLLAAAATSDAGSNERTHGQIGPAALGSVSPASSCPRSPHAIASMRLFSAPPQLILCFCNPGLIMLDRQWTRAPTWRDLPHSGM